MHVSIGHSAARTWPGLWARGCSDLRCFGWLAGAYRVGQNHDTQGLDASFTLKSRPALYNSGCGRQKSCVLGAWSCLLRSKTDSGCLFLWRLRSIGTHFCGEIGLGPWKVCLCTRVGCCLLGNLGPKVLRYRVNCVFWESAFCKMSNSRVF